MRLGAILDRQPAVQQFVGLEVGAVDVGVGVVGLGEEAGGAQDHAGQGVFEMSEAAETLGRELGDAVDVARLQRAGALVEPDRGLALLGADRLTRSSARSSR